MDRIVWFLFPDLFMLAPLGSRYQLHGEEEDIRMPDGMDVWMVWTSHVSAPAAVKGGTLSVPPLNLL